MAFKPVAGTNLQFRLIVSKHKLPQTKMVVKPAQLADIEGSHLYGQHIISKVTNTKVKSSQELKNVLIKIYCIKKCLLDLDPV
jgi:hypothetical protein